MITYISTRDEQIKVNSMQAILDGLSADGGLYVPETLDDIKLDYHEVIRHDYFGMAKAVFMKFFADFGEECINKIVHSSYKGKFSTKEITPLVKVGNGHILELFHGPTCAFKDVALSALPNLMSEAARLTGFKDEILILTATSGDTGSAALHGFSNVKGTKIAVFYPDNGISSTQRLQMVTQDAPNTKAFAVKGNFDDAQTGVKRLFQDIPHPCEGVSLSSANSINIGRLVPQVVYYFAAYKALFDAGEINDGDLVDFTVPTGNFGDIMAGYFAKAMGLPVGKLICASNKNDVLTEFLSTGHYNKKRNFHKTSSPSMDILVSSNLERLLYYVCGADKAKGYMRKLTEKGEYTISQEELAKINENFVGYSCDDIEGSQAIAKVFSDQNYVMDTHTAIAWGAYLKHNGEHKNVVLSTASPYKFTTAVLKAVGTESTGDDFADMKKLSELSKTEIPNNLKVIFEKPVVHDEVIEVAQMREKVVSYAELK